MKHASNHRRYTTQKHTQKMADYESAAAAVVKSFCLYWRASGSMRPFVRLCVLCVPWRRWTDSPSLSACRKTIQSLGTEGHNEVAAPLG